MAAAKPIPAARISNPPPNTPDPPPRRATRGAFLLGLALVLVAPVTVSAAGVREEHPNLVGGELLGRGFALTLNYERFLNNHFGLGGGVMASARLSNWRG